MFRIEVDDHAQVESWGESQWETREKAWDAYLRVLDKYGAVPGWDCLIYKHKRFMNCQDVRINGVSLIEMADVLHCEDGICADC